MSLYALISGGDSNGIGGTVANCIVADSDFISTIQNQFSACVEYVPGTYVGAGFTWDGTNFIAPVVINPDDSGD